MGAQVAAVYSDSSLDFLAQARARKAIVEKAKRAPPHSSRKRAIITAFRLSPDYVSKRRANR
jgi:hypothetical protein